MERDGRRFAVHDGFFEWIQTAHPDRIDEPRAAWANMAQNMLKMRDVNARGARHGKSSNGDYGGAGAWRTNAAGLSLM